jgi:hypothetical protein
MKTAVFGLMLTALLASGCVQPWENPFIFGPDDVASQQAAQDAQLLKHAPAVRADQVTTENASEKARALEEELENDRQAPPK